MKIIVTNRRARFDYELFDHFEAGLVLMGSEIKSIRENKVSINEAFVTFHKNEAFIINMHISKYEYTGSFIPDEDRTRKLLLNKSEIRKIQQRIKLEKLTLIPLKLYFTKNHVKVEIALARGKKIYDKRETIKKRDEERRLRRS